MGLFPSDSRGFTHGGTPLGAFWGLGSQPRLWWSSDRSVISQSPGGPISPHVKPFLVVSGDVHFDRWGSTAGLEAHASGILAGSPQGIP